MRSIAVLFAAAFITTPFVALGQSTDPEGLWAEAALYRDDWGVPHIYAQRPRALAFAFGYAQASDHAEEMLLAYRYATGRAAEVLGEDYAPSDVFMLKTGHAALAASAIQSADPLTRDLCEGFALGANTWLADNKSAAPQWATPVKPAEVLALWHCYILSFAPFDLPGAFRPLPAAHTGNAWAMAPARSRNNQSLLVINPHEYYDGPFRWYEAHLAVGDYDMAGLTLFGLPILLQGHNNVLGWALTPNHADTADILEERVNIDAKKAADLPALYRTLLKSEALLQYVAQSQEFNVLTPGGIDRRSTPTHYSALGPVFEGGAVPIAARRAVQAESRRRPANVTYQRDSNDAVATGLVTWAVGGYNEFGGLRQLFEMGRATNPRTFQAALAAQQLPCFHVVYADRAGNIFYGYNARTRAKTPVAPDVTDVPNPWSVPVPQELRIAALGAPVLAARLPALMNPPRGFVQACGNPPWGATIDGDIKQAALPPWFALDADSFRAQYVRRSLLAGPRSFDDMQAMVYDTYAPAAAELTPRLLTALGERGAATDLGIWKGALESWNFLAEPGSTGMTFFNAWWEQLNERLGAETLPVLFSDADRAAEAAKLAAGRAVSRLNAAQSSGIMSDWGAVHQVRRGTRTEPIFGGDAGDPIFLTSEDAHNATDGKVHYGFSHAMVVRFDDIPETASVALFGSSENEASPHFDDQLDLVLAKRFKYPDYARAQVIRNAAEARGRNIMLLPQGVEGELAVSAAAPVTVTMETLTESPSPLPPDLAAFTLYTRVAAAEGEAVPIECAVRIAVPEAVCAARNLDELALYAFDIIDGWQRVKRPVFDAETRSWTARHPGTGTFTILGPEALLLPEEGAEATEIPTEEAGD